jgi:hypothetical protein
MNQLSSITLGRWIRSTWIGWLIGVPLIVIFALLGEMLGIGGSQGLVGLGMGAGVGWMQRRVLAPVLDRSIRWLWATMIGLSIPFVGYDLLRLMNVEMAFSLYVAVAIGGGIVGLWQGLILVPLGVSLAAWMLASLAGWSAAAAMAGAIPVTAGPSGIAGALLYLATVAVGGAIPGLVTGLVLRRVEFNRGG